MPNLRVLLAFVVRNLLSLARVKAGAPVVVLVFAQRFDEIIFALAGQARRILFSREILIVAEVAAVLLDEKNYADALKLLEAKHPESFDGLYSDLRGHVLNAQGKTDEAKSAYKLAYEKTDSKSMYRNLIQKKLDALGVTKRS